MHAIRPLPGTRPALGALVLGLAALLGGCRSREALSPRAPGPPSSTRSTLVASPSSIPVGGGSATVVVTARDANANPIAGATVLRAASGSGNALLQPTSQTDASGAATGTLSSSGV